MHRPLPLSILTTIDPVLRDSALIGTVVDTPRLAVLRYDLDDADDVLRRVVMDAHGVVEDLLVPLEHACLSCAVREDAVPTLARLAGDGRWTAMLLALPVSAESHPVCRALTTATATGGGLARVRLASVACAVDLAAFEHDLLGADLLAERDLALTLDDRRAVGEALAAQVGHADVVIAETDDSGPSVASDLLDHVRARDSHRVDGLHRMDVTTLLDHRHDAHRGDRRLDPHAVAPGDGPTARGVWTLDLHSPRPFHPDRLVAQVERLGAARARSRGRFWVPTRPDSACVWDGAGGQLGIGELGPWHHRRPSTRLVYTGTGDERPALLEAFAELLLTDREAEAGLAPWLGREDVLTPWLGDRSSAG